LTKLDPAARECLAGLTTTNSRFFLTSLLVGVVLLAVTKIGLPKGWFWRLDAGWLLSTPFDDWTHTIWVVNQLHKSSDTTAIYRVGGSDSRQAVISNESMTTHVQQQTEHGFRCTRTRSLELLMSWDC